MTKEDRPVNHWHRYMHRRVCGAKSLYDLASSDFLKREGMNKDDAKWLNKPPHQQKSQKS